MIIIVDTDKARSLARLLAVLSWQLDRYIYEENKSPVGVKPC